MEKYKETGTGKKQINSFDMLVTSWWGLKKTIMITLLSEIKTQYTVIVKYTVEVIKQCKKEKKILVNSLQIWFTDSTLDL